MERTSHASRYVPITQQPFSCVAACLQMILLRRKLKLLSQDKIGVCLGLTVPLAYKKLLPYAKTGKKPSTGWGTQVQKEKYSINHFFKTHEIPLEESFCPLSKISRPVEWLDKQIIEGHDIICCFRYNALYGGSGEGHVSILDSINGKTAVLIDPEKNVPKYRLVKTTKFFSAIKAHGESHRAGFWVISEHKT